MSFIYVGRLDELKGIKILFQAWKLMGDNAPELKVCGTGPLEDWCKEYISQNGLKTVSMLGFVPNTEARELIANSEALILPTQWYEGFPMTILEAYSVGTPVIASDLGNAGSLIIEGVTGCKFQCDSGEGIVKAIKQLADYKKIRQTTAEEYEHKYASSKNYERLLNIYQEAAKMNMKCYTTEKSCGGGYSKTVVLLPCYEYVDTECVAA